MTDPQQLTPATAYQFAMLVWGSMMGGVLLIAGMFYFIIRGTEPMFDDPATRHGVLAVTGGIVLAGAVAGVVARAMFMKRRDETGRVPPMVFVTGQIVGLGIIEGAAVMSLVAMMVMGEALPYVLPALVAVGVMMAMKPNRALVMPSPDVERA